MKHIKPYQIFESQEPQHPDFPKTEVEIHRLCKEYDITNYTINEDLSIDVEGGVNLKGFNLTYLPLNFNHVSGDFVCSDNKLTTLIGAPHTVGGNFSYSYNKLTSLKGSPKKIGGNFNFYYNKLETLKGAPNSVGGFFNCSHNNLTSLEGCPNEVGGFFNCSYNKLTSLEGCPNILRHSFYCSNNKLTSLEGSPKEVGGDFYCYENQLTTLEGGPYTVGNLFHCSNNNIMSLEYLHNNGINYTFTSFYGNPINSLVNTFFRKDNIKEFISEFNHYRITDGQIVYLERLEMFCGDFDLEMPDIDEVKKHYTIV